MRDVDVYIDLIIRQHSEAVEILTGAGLSLVEAGRFCHMMRRIEMDPTYMAKQLVEEKGA